MLDFQNSALRKYLAKKNIAWTEDPSNQYMNHDRNFVRHQLLPLLENRWPKVSKRLLLTRKAMTGARHLLETLADEKLGKALVHPLVLELSDELLTDTELLKLVMRRWIKQTGRHSIPAYRLETFCQQLLHAGTDNKISICWDDCVLRFYRQHLWLQTGADIQPCKRIVWPVDEKQLELGKDSGCLRINPTNANVHRSQVLPQPEFAIGGRNSLTENVLLRGGQHKSLKNLLQAAGIPPWLRDCIPLCAQEGELLAVGDWCFSDRFETWLHKNNTRLSWHPEHPVLRLIRAQQHRIKP
jgi:tRNA(Ile)-lysidine synthase